MIAPNTGSTLTDRESSELRTIDILKYEDRVIMDFVSFVVLNTLVCLFGIAANMINFIIFLRQGLNTTMNISFFSLAISDLVSLVTLQWTNICLNPLVASSNWPMYSVDIQYLTTGWLHVCFGRITCFITAFMTAERCLCIALPLKVKQILTHRKTAMIMTLIYILNLGSVIPEYASTYFDWKFFPERNRSLLGIAFRENRKAMEGLSFIFLACMSCVSFPAVIFFTAILVVKLRQQAKWRSMAVAKGDKFKRASKRDIKTMSMVLLIAIILIACYTPGLLASLAASFVPGFSIVGDQTNLFCALWGFIVLFEAVNSSANIFLYYKMSTKFKNSFRDMFGKCLKDSSHPVREDEMD